MGIYACNNCFAEHGFEPAPIQWHCVGSCETCGHLRGDWRQTTVTFTHDVTRDTLNCGPIAKQLTDRRTRAAAGAALAFWMPS